MLSIVLWAFALALIDPGSPLRLSPSGSFMSPGRIDGIIVSQFPQAHLIHSNVTENGKCLPRGKRTIFKVLRKMRTTVLNLQNHSQNITCY